MAMAPKLHASTLYWVGDGRIACGDVKCCGYHCAYTGRNIHGYKCVRVTTAEVQALKNEGIHVSCDACGRVTEGSDSMLIPKRKRDVK